MVNQETIELLKKVMRGWVDWINSTPGTITFGDARYKALETEMKEVYKGVSSIDDSRELVKTAPDELIEWVSQWIWYSANLYKNSLRPPAATSYQGKES